MGTSFEQWGIEVGGQVQLEEGRKEIGRMLCTMDRLQILDSLQLQQQPTLENDIHVVSTFQLNTLAGNGYCLFTVALRANGE
jgi:hypothetical protein